jgi:hypothetical protein
MHRIHTVANGQMFFISDQPSSTVYTFYQMDIAIVEVK